MQLRIVALGSCKFLHVYRWLGRQGIDVGEYISGSIFQPVYVSDIYDELGDKA